TVDGATLRLGRPAGAGLALRTGSRQRGRREIFVERACLGCRAAALAQPDHANDADMRAPREGEDVPGADRLMRLVDDLAVKADLAGGAQLGGERAALAEAGVPQPLVEPPRRRFVHLPNLRSPSRANGESPVVAGPPPRGVRRRSGRRGRAA